MVGFGVRPYKIERERADPIIIHEFLKLQCGLFLYIQVTSRTIGNHKFMFGVKVN